MADICHEVFLVIHEVRVLLRKHVCGKRHVTVFVVPANTGFRREITVRIGNDCFVDVLQVFRMVHREQEKYEEQNQEAVSRYDVHADDEIVGLVGRT